MELDREITNEIIKSGNTASKIAEKDIYHFGLWTGNSMVRFQDELIRKNLIPHKIYGFDSFSGLPEEDKKVKCYKGHVKGVFNTVKDLNVKTVTEAIKIIKDRCPLKKQTNIIPGYFIDVFESKSIEKKVFFPAAYIEIDVDLYVSTKQILNWMTEKKLIVSGTIIYFDDFGGVPQYQGGESLAWKQWSEKYNIKCERVLDIGDGNPHRHVIMRIL